MIFSEKSWVYNEKTMFDVWCGWGAICWWLEFPLQEIFVVCLVEFDVWLHMTHIAMDPSPFNIDLEITKLYLSIFISKQQRYHNHQFFDGRSMKWILRFCNLHFFPLHFSFCTFLSNHRTITSHTAERV